MSRPLQPLSRRLLGIVLLAMGLAIVAQAVLHGWHEHASLTKNFRRNMERQARTFSALVEDAVRKHDARILRLLEENRDEEASTDDRVAALLPRLFFLDPFDIFFIVDRSHAVVAVSRPYEKFLGIDLAGLPAVTSPTRISAVYQSLFSKLPVVAVRYPIDDHHILFLERNLHNILPGLAHIWTMDERETIFLLAADGTVLAHPDDSLVESRANLLFDMKGLQNRTDGLISYTMHGENYRALRHELRTPDGWTLYLQVPERLITDQVQNAVFYSVLIISLLCFAVFVLLSLLLDRFLTRPVQRITRALARPAAGPAAAIDPALSDGIDEFASVIAAVNGATTSLHEANSTLEAQQQYIRLLLDSTAEAIYGLDTEGRCTFCNRSFLQLTGFSDEKDVLGARIHDLIHHFRKNGSDYPASLCPAHHAYLHSREVHHDEDVFWRRDGSSFPVEFWSHPIRQGDAVTGAVVTFIDISDRRAALTRLRRSEEMYRTLVENIDMGITLIDRNFTILAANLGQGKLFGVDPASFIGRKCHQEFEKRLQPCDHCPGRVALANDEPAESTTQGVRDDGSRFTVRIRAFPVRDEDGRPQAFIEVVEDVTDRLRLEEELQRTRKLESVGVLAGGIAHDFNNLLTAILGNLGLARQSGDDRQRCDHLLGEAEKATLRARHLTQQLLTFAKGGEPLRETAAIAEVIRDSAGFILSGSNVGCDFDIPAALCPVLIDRGQISQVIQNLVLNAREAMAQGGRITISCRNETLNAGELPLAAGDYVRIDIADQGEGIPAAILDRIFDPYFTTKQQGSGLGLAVTHSIIGKHDGHIEVHSSPGQGTVFTLRLPALCGAVAEDGQQAGDELTSGQGRILIMDDEEMIRDMAGAMLRHLGYTPVFARDGEEAVAVYRQGLEEEGEGIAAVIMDLTIPGGMGGKEAVREILALDPRARVIVSSGYSNDPIMADCRRHGFVAAVVKPYQLHQLAGILEAALEGEVPAGA
ncbi:MAG: PAS domain S-box protein [Thermodesulfobacteriota bacterium]